MDDAMKRLIVVLQSKGILITVADMEFISGVISENEWLGFDSEDAEMNDDKCNGCYWNYNGSCTCMGMKPCNYEEVKE